jgi:hypothetical protein
MAITDIFMIYPKGIAKKEDLLRIQQIVFFPGTWNMWEEHIQTQEICQVPYLW